MSSRDDGDRDSATRFLELVDRDKDERCEQLARKGMQSATELRRAARRDATARVARAVREARAVVQQRVEATRAELSTEERRTAHDVASTLLSRGWERTQREILRRWQSPKERDRWVGRLVQEAGRLLPRVRWLVEHAPLDADDLEALRRRVRAASGSEPQLALVATLRAGLRVSADGAALDGSLSGLLAVAPDVEGRLLVELTRPASPAVGGRK